MSAETFIQEGLADGSIHKTPGFEILTIDGHRSSYAVYEVKVDRLSYNVRNGRIATFISRYKQDVGELPGEGTPEMNDLIEKFIEEDNPKRLNKTKLDIQAKGQQRPAVVLSNGVIIDGNRRFTCLRKLQREEGETRYLRCFILDSSLDDKSLKGLELELQFGQDEKVSYDPISRLVDIYEWCRVGDMDTEFYRSKAGMSKKDMDSFLGQADLMVEFLQFINADEQFHIVQDLKLQGPLEALYNAVRKCHDDDRAEDLKIAVFANCLTKSVGDLTRHVRKMCDVALSSGGEEFLEEQIDIAQDILEKLEELPDDKDVDIAFVRDTIRADESLSRRQEASFDRANRLNMTEKVKSSQVKEVARARESLARVEVELLGNLSEKSLEEMLKDLAETRDLVEKLYATVTHVLEG